MVVQIRVRDETVQVDATKLVKNVPEMSSTLTRR